MVMKYMNGHSLSIADINDTVAPAVRMTLLRWIAAANTTGDKKGRTEFGQAFTLRKDGGQCILHCEDGDLTMPAYVFEFEVDNHA